jgi:23S rRNA (uracil1939-C5)-methyltransferase
VNDTPAEVTNVPSTLLWGEDAIEEELLGLRFRVRPNAFLQTNTRWPSGLYELAIDFAGLTGGETVYDLYCGIGTIGLSMASRALTVWGVEVEEESVACALENADLNGIANAAFFAGNVGSRSRSCASARGDPDVVVVDPPRAGLAARRSSASGDRCAAARLRLVQSDDARGDSKRLREEYGYELVRARPVDMFPHTPHVETVALLDAVTSFLCKACGTQFPESAEPPARVRSAATSGSTFREEGQAGSTYDEVRVTHRADIREEVPGSPASA